jgi:drug/metabolite transporter (DMT)-like permease
VPFAILFGWLFLAEFPPVASLLGGAIVLAAVFAHAARDLAVARAEPAILEKCAVAKKN